STIATRHRLSGIKGAVLPGAVGVGCAQHLFGSFQLFSALNERDRRSGASIESIPKRLTLRDLCLGELVRFIDKVCITDAERAVPVIRHTVIAESIYVIDLQPVKIHGEKIIAR